MSEVYFDIDPNIPPLGVHKQRLIGQFNGAYDALAFDAGQERNARYRVAGLRQASILLRDGQIMTVTFSIDDTPIVDAIAAIGADAEEGILAPDAEVLAMRAVGDGTFFQEWGAYMPGQTP